MSQLLAAMSKLVDISIKTLAASVTLIFCYLLIGTCETQVREENRDSHNFFNLVAHTGKY